MDEKELENPENWNFDEAERHEAVRNRRSIVSVAIPSEEFVIIAKAAEREGLKLSQYLREAALEKAKGSNAGRLLTVAALYLGGSGQLFAQSDHPLGPSTRIEPPYYEEVSQ
jgi:hypothetical protein